MLFVKMLHYCIHMFVLVLMALDASNRLAGPEEVLKCFGCCLISSSALLLLSLWDLVGFLDGIVDGNAASARIEPSYI